MEPFAVSEWVEVDCAGAQLIEAILLRRHDNIREPLYRQDAVRFV